MADECQEKWVETRRRCEPKFALDGADRLCGQEESWGVLLGVNVEAENVSTIRITVAQWGQRKPVMGVAMELSGAGDGEAWE